MTTRTVLAACVSKLGRHNYFPASAFLHGQKRVAKTLRTYSCYSGRPRQGERLTDLHQLMRDESAAATVRAVGASVEKDAAVH